MHAAFLFIHFAAASIWVGGHLVLVVSLLPEAMSKRDPEFILGFQRIYERIGLPAMVVQVVTGLWLTQLELKLEQSAQPAAHKTHREERARRDIDEVLNDYLEWIQDTMTTERTPWLKVICATVSDG